MPYVCRVTYPAKYYFSDYHEGLITAAVGLSTESGMLFGKGKRPSERDLGFIRKTRKEAEIVAEKVKSLELEGVAATVQEIR